MADFRRTCHSPHHPFSSLAIEKGSGLCYNAARLTARPQTRPSSLTHKNTYTFAASLCRVMSMVEDIPMNDMIKSLEIQENPHPELAPGDTVRVHVRIVEGNRERIQVVPGMIIRLRGGGNNRNFTVRRTASHGIGVERTFLLNSPRVEKIEIVRRAKVRRAQLYFMRERSGKSARLKERR